MAFTALTAHAGAPTDAWITTKAKLALLTTEGVSVTDVNVDTVQGQVTLHGKVTTQAEKDKAAAADTYIRVTKAKIDRDTLIKLIDNPQYEFTVTPKNTYKLADFLYRVGAIKHKPESWKDYFFQDERPLQGS